MKKFNLSEWLSWMEQCHPSEIELGLARVSEVAEKLAIDLSQSTVVTVGGTNGKGSTVSYLNCIYQHAGYSVGCYTSPHFLYYNERVRLDSRNVSDALLCDAFERIDQARGEVPLTYFEFGTLAALLIFSDQKPDLVLLEVGLGGRLDAVNIIDADISVVTTVAIDHIDWLGDDRDQIGFEKAGIYRPGRPAVCGDLSPPPSIARHAAEIGAKLYQAGTEFSYSAEGELWCWKGETVNGNDRQLNQLSKPSLPLQNAATALQVSELIPLEVTESDLRYGIQFAELTGRMQHIEKTGVHYWLDVAHNPEAAELLKEQILGMPGNVTLILGMLADKDCQQVIEILEPVVTSVCLVSLDVPRGQKAEELSKLFSDKTEAWLFSSVTEAIGHIQLDTDSHENVIIAGSFFTVSHALTELGRDQ